MPEINYDYEPEKMVHYKAIISLRDQIEQLNKEISIHEKIIIALDLKRKKECTHLDSGLNQIYYNWCSEKYECHKCGICLTHEEAMASPNYLKWEDSE